MTSLRFTTIVASVGCLVFIGAWVLHFAHEPWATDSSRWADFGDYLGGTIAPILAFASFVGLLASAKKEQLQSDSKAHFAIAKVSMGRAYDVLIDANGQPISDRLAWLTAARLILEARQVAKGIRVQSIKAMYAAEEEYWRRRFYDALQLTSASSPLANPNYFIEGEKKLKGYVIDERSIKVLYEFVDWPEGQVDPMDGVSKFTDKELSAMILGKRGAREFLETQRRTN